ncbi:MAG: hypothetical protein WC455_13175 [Dehalococcoidia bacterium]|jgi:hypothetical protein
MIRKQVLVDLQEEIFEKLEHFAKNRGLEVDEAVRVIIGEALVNFFISKPVWPNPPSDPMDVVYNMMEAVGMASCRKCTAKLTAEEIKKNKSLCFNCQPDLDNLYGEGAP